VERRDLITSGLVVVTCLIPDQMMHPSSAYHIRLIVDREKRDVWKHGC
jgi:hypothetical protein